MGRKKKKKNAVIFCYYCDKHFDNEKVLIEHQRGKHFKCPICRRRLSSARGVMIHVFQVHKQSMDAVPHSKENRDGFDLEIFGMVNVPQELIQEKMIKIYGEPEAKKQKIQHAQQPIIQIPGISRQIPFPGLTRMNVLGSNLMLNQQRFTPVLGGMHMLNPQMKITTGMPPTGVRLQPLGGLQPQPPNPLNQSHNIVTQSHPPIQQVPPQNVQIQPQGSIPSGMQPQIPSQPQPGQPPNQQQHNNNQHGFPQNFQQRGFQPVHGGWNPMIQPNQQIQNPNQPMPSPNQNQPVQPIARHPEQVHEVRKENKKKIVRIFDTAGYCMEEMRAANPKYSGVQAR